MRVLEAVVPTRVQERLCVCCALASFGSDTGKTWNRAGYLMSKLQVLPLKLGFIDLALTSRLSVFTQGMPLHELWTFRAANGPTHFLSAPPTRSIKVVFKNL